MRVRALRKNERLRLVHSPLIFVWNQHTIVDKEAIFRSVRKTHRAVIVEENWPFASVGAEIAAQIQYECFDDLDAPVARVSQACSPVPYADSLEKAVLPSKEQVIEAVKHVVYID